MPKKKKVKNSNKIVDALTTREVMDEFNKIVRPPCDPWLLRDNTAQTLKKYEESGRKDVKVKEEFDKLSRSAMFLNGLNNHYHLAESVREEYRPLLIEMGNELAREYDCKTPSEKSLVHLVLAAYGRILEYTKTFNNCLRLDWLSSEKNGYYGMLSKELDRANRHFITALSTLRAMKQPPMKVSIKTENAFVAQNQQLNSIRETKKHSGE